MKKDECEQAVRHLATKWFHTLPPEDREHPSFTKFKQRRRDNRYDGYLNFRSRMGAHYDAEMWLTRN